jgi:hypothetical protein
MAESHALVLRPIYTISQFIKKVPPFPGACPSILTEAWKDRARKFAEFCLVVFRQWKGKHGLPESITWRGFVNICVKFKKVCLLLTEPGQLS